MGGLTEIIVSSPDMWPIVLNAVIDLKGRFTLSLTYLLIYKGCYPFVFIMVVYNLNAIMTCADCRGLIV